MPIFAEISIIIVIAAVIAGLMHLLRQPLIIGHIITGLIVGPYLFNILNSTEVVDVFAEIGIALLLFIVGLGLNPKLIKEVGGVSLIAGLGQIIFTSGIGYYLCRMLEFSPMASLYIAIALTFSSTIIIVKLLSDKHDLQRLYGKIALGILLVQDIVATLVLIVFSAWSDGSNITRLVAAITVQEIALIALFIFISIYILPKLSSFFAKSPEFLFLFSVAWGLGIATLFKYLGLSIEIGALVAGIMLSISPYNTEITAKLKPLRDFFIIMFFIYLGFKMVIGNIGALLMPTIIFSLFVLIGNPLIVMTLMGLLGYKKRVGFFTGLTVAQISEFSLILIMLGVTLGHINETILSLITFVGLITIAVSTYLILYSDQIYNVLRKPLSIFERKIVKKEKKLAKNYDIILFGHNRIGYDFIASFKKIKKTFLVVDFDPEIIKYLQRKEIDCRYGDADDVEFLEDLNLNKIKMAVSTIPDYKTNILIAKKIRQANPSAIIIMIAHNIREAEQLYSRKVSYVILPHFLGGKYASNLIARFGLKKSDFNQERKGHLKYLKQRKQIGHEHPIHERER